MHRGSREREFDKKSVVYRCLGDREFCEDVTSEEEEEEEGISGGVLTSQSYTYDSVFSFQDDAVHAFM